MLEKRLYHASYKAGAARPGSIDVARVQIEHFAAGAAVNSGRTYVIFSATLDVAQKIARNYDVRDSVTGETVKPLHTVESKFDERGMYRGHQNP